VNSSLANDKMAFPMDLHGFTTGPFIFLGSAEHLEMFLPGIAAV
jgi:hypothetical protein